jgi:hypothetical protein
MLVRPLLSLPVSERAVVNADYEGLVFPLPNEGMGILTDDTATGCVADMAYIQLALDALVALIA